MGTYRLIPVDFDGPLLLEPQTFTAVNDDDAVAKATTLLRDHNTELWDGGAFGHVLSRAQQVEPPKSDLGSDGATPFKTSTENSASARDRRVHPML
jgi:hypothetical protein